MSSPRPRGEGNMSLIPSQQSITLNYVCNKVLRRLRDNLWHLSCDDYMQSNLKLIIQFFWNVCLFSRKLWSSQLWTQLKQLRIEAWKSQDFNGDWTRDLAIPVRHFNQLSYEVTDGGNWSFVSSNEPVKNGCEVIYEMFHIFKPRWSPDFFRLLYAIA